MVCHFIIHAFSYCNFAKHLFILCNANPPPLSNKPVVIVPELFGSEDNWDIYYKLVEEMRALQKENSKGSEWISWHEGAHLISKNPKGSPTFERVINRLCEYFNIQKKSIGLV